MDRFVSIGDLVADVYYDRELKLIMMDGGITSHNIACNLSSMGFNTFAFGVCGDDTFGKIAIQSLNECGVKNDILVDKTIRTKAYHIRNILLDGKYCFKSIKYCPCCEVSSWYEGSYLNEKEIINKIQKDDVLIFGNLNAKNQFIIDNTNNLKLLDLGQFNEFDNMTKEEILKKLKNKFEIINLNERVEKFLLKTFECKNDIELSNLINVKLLTITRGKCGNDFVYDGQIVSFSPQEIIDEIDDSGAGDAFFSIIIKNYFNSNKKVSAKALEQLFNESQSYVKTVLQEIGSRTHIKKSHLASLI